MPCPEGAHCCGAAALPFVRNHCVTLRTECQASLLLYREIPLTCVCFAKTPHPYASGLRLRPPAYLRRHMENDFPRLFATKPLRPPAPADRTLGPFPTRARGAKPATPCLTSSSCAAAWRSPTLSRTSCLPYFEMKNAWHRAIRPARQTATARSRRCLRDVHHGAKACFHRSNAERARRIRSASRSEAASPSTSI